ncbi:amidohydrolase 2 [Pholiota conissans]|uniref:Amidohydrolase 2 n=1 Tax=Pholiota conissans TaxID=109636 RepID=A0A9P5YZH5_9AGAR|nr:amidohydrolase 2 [Pholiota conissans]
MHLFTATVLALVFSPCLFARKIRNTGGTIVFEEAWTIPALLGQTSNTTAAQGGTNDELKANLLDIHNQRLQQMDTNKIDFMVLSCASPCIQGIADPDAAAEMAITVNNALADAISNNTERFGAFASLAMQNATTAAAELTRAVKELGFLGVLLNDYQQSGPDGLTPLYYDQPEYDIFWQTLSDLDVPFYLHPRTDIPSILNFQYAHAPFLKGPAQQFAATLSGHVLGICVNGVFDRFPKAKLIVGHFGERVPSDLVRIDAELIRQLPLGLPMQKNVTTYWHENIFETSSGNFATDLLKFHIGQIGLDRIMYSIDYPFVNIPQGTTWVNTLPHGVLNKREFESFSRGLAIELLHLDD